MGVIECSPKIAEFLLSNPILSPGTPHWLHIKTPGNAPKLWLWIPDEVYSPPDRRTKKA